ncbi:hypothetical protein H5410_028301 [Solanum commersonii]|uniref:Cell differentiation protein rcd1 n=1 Tax=Solanum commersonii TaxID=4109 RepID=A0A9J5Z1P6_SOLCO|nr:hypothetical protein H5410_028301 [Solanum commersonii]
MNLRESSNRENVLIELNNFIIEQSTEAMRMDLGFHLWNSSQTLTILLQCMASHSDARIGLLKANIPYFLNPFLRISENVMSPLQFVTLSILNLIAALAKFDESHGQEILLLLLDTQVVPLCLHCILHGDQLIRKVATHILMKILMQEKGLKYCCALPARFLLVIQVLRQLDDPEIPNMLHQLVLNLTRQPPQ